MRPCLRLVAKQGSENSTLERWDRQWVPEACLIFADQSFVQWCHIVRFNLCGPRGDAETRSESEGEGQRWIVVKNVTTTREALLALG